MRRKAETIAETPEVEAVPVASPVKKRRKRNDPGVAPVDGDLRMDQVLNTQNARNKGWQPLLLTDEDYAMNWRQWGAVKETRGPDSMRPAFDMSSEGDSGYRAGGLTLYKVKKEVHQARASRAQKESTDRMRVMGREALGSVGGEFHESHG